MHFLPWEQQPKGPPILDLALRALGRWWPYSRAAATASKSCNARRTKRCWYTDAHGSPLPTFVEVEVRGYPIFFSYYESCAAGLTDHLWTESSLATGKDLYLQSLWRFITIGPPFSQTCSAATCALSSLRLGKYAPI